MAAFIAYCEEKSLFTAFFPTVNFGMFCCEIPGEKIGFAPVSASIAFKKNIQQLLRNAYICLKLCGLQGSGIRKAIPDCLKHNMGIGDGGFCIDFQHGTIQGVSCDCFRKVSHGACYIQAKNNCGGRRVIHGVTGFPKCHLIRI